MALVYGDNYVHIIKKDGVEYKVRDAVAEAAINIIQGDASTEGSILKAKADAISTAAADATSKADAAQSAAAADATSKVSTAKSEAISTAAADATSKANAAQGAAEEYAKDLVDKVLGSDSAAETLTSLQNVLNELNDPSNQDGITGTFIDAVKNGLAGLGNKTNAIYNFESFDPSGETKWGEGTAEVIELRNDGATIKVLTNSTDQSFVGRMFNINTLDTDELIPLYSTEGLDVGVSVRVSLNAEAVPNTVKDYVDDAVADVVAGQSQSSIENGILTLGI